MSKFDRFTVFVGEAFSGLIVAALLASVASIFALPVVLLFLLIRLVLS